MEAPLLRINSGSFEIDSHEEVAQIPELRPEAARKGIDYENLGVLLRKYSYPHYDANHDSFWSSDLLGRILTRERIVEELERYRRSHQCFRHRSSLSLAETILQGNGNPHGQSPSGVQSRYLKIFAVLLLIDKGRLIDTFVDARVVDGDLPLVNCNTTEKCLSMLSRQQAPESPLACFDPWKLHKREMFARWQHRLDIVFLGLAPSGKIQHRRLESRAVFPWIAYKSKGAGGYGCVYHAVAPPDCHAFTSVLGAIVFNNRFAVKELKQKDEMRMEKEEVHFWKEVDMLKKFSGAFHDHLVTLLMTWSIDDRHYFLFPWAPCDLDLFWSDEKRWSVDEHNQCLKRETMLWTSKQILGLTEALHQIHNPKHLAEAKFGRHGDLKPENILWYESPKDLMGILVIADFGLGSFNSAKSRSNIPGEAIPVTPNYRPPECDLEGGKISRSFDIWTFGCLLLELTTWALGGKELRAAFEEARTTPYITGISTDIFFDVERQGDSNKFVIKRKQEVTEWITDLHNHAGCTQYFHDLLDIIEDKMLIVLTPTQDRIKCSDLVKAIGDMHEKVKKESSPYSRQLCPRERKVKAEVAFSARLNNTAKGNLSRHPTIVDNLGVHRGEVRASKTPNELRALADVIV